MSSAIILDPKAAIALAGFLLFHYDGSTASNFRDITSQLFPTRIGNFPLNNPSSFGEDARGELYITDIGNGNVYKITPRR